MQKHLTSFHLKIIAIIAMTINHAGQIFAPQFNPPWWEFFYLTIGKITFPVMAYMLLEGLKYTKSFPKYLERLLGYAVLSIVPFHLALVQNQPIYGLNNVLFTLSIGLILIKLIESTKRLTKIVPIEYIFLIIAMLLTIKSDWNIIGIFIIWILYKHPNDFARPLIIFTTALTVINFLGSYNLMTFNYLGILLVIPILRQYNGQKGFSNTIIKHGFYIYYPLHLTILWLISLYLNG